MSKHQPSEGPKYSRQEILGTPPRASMVILGMVGLLAIAVGTLLPILNVYNPGAVTWWRWVYAGGALVYLVAKFFSPYTGKQPRVKRLYRIESWSAIFFAVAAFFIFYNGNMTRDVWAFTLAGGALLIFTSIAIPRAIKKALN